MDRHFDPVQTNTLDHYIDSPTIFLLCSSMLPLYMQACLQVLSHC